MRALTDHERRTIRFAAVGIGIYLVLFFGLRGGKYFEKKRSEYHQLLRNAQTLKLELQPYEEKFLVVKKLMDASRLDPAKLSKASVVAEASTAIQKAGTTSGVQIGHIRESPASTSTRELASMQLEGIGPVSAVMSLLHRLESLGYPLILDSVQMTPEVTKPGMVKLNLTIVILDFDQWKSEGGPHA